MAILKREYGAEQPYIPLGIFKLRLPFLHYSFSSTEFLQGAIMVPSALAGGTMMMEAIGIPWPLALSAVCLYVLLNILHCTFGDPVTPGWITPAVPLVLAYVLGFPAGEARVMALMSVQIMVAMLFLVMGITGMSKRVMMHIPMCIRMGIILGAGITAIYSTFKPGGRIEGVWISSCVAVLLTYVILYSPRFSALKEKYPWMGIITNYGMLPGLIMGFVVGVICNEIKMPALEWGISDVTQFGNVISGYSIFAVGIPPLAFWVQGIPLALACYIIAFGDFLMSEEILRDTDKARADEYVEFNPVRSSLLCAFRNFFFGLLAPYTVLAGPFYAGGVIPAAEHYKQGPKAMDSFYDGVASCAWGMCIAAFLALFVSLFSPVNKLAMILVLTLQGFACAYIAMGALKQRQEMAIAMIMGTVMASSGTAYCLAVGVVLYLCIGVKKPEPVQADSSSVAVQEA